MSDYQLQANGYIVRKSDGAWIPPDANNADWRIYQAWLAAGNVPDPMPGDRQ